MQMPQYSSPSYAKAGLPGEVGPSKAKRSGLGLLSALLLAAPSFSLDSVYVDPNVAGPGTGTMSDPYSSLQFALLQPSTQSGDTIHIFAGTLAENVVHPQGLANITIRSLNGQVIFDGMGLSSCYRQVATGVERVTFRGQLLFRNGAGSPSSLGLAGGALRFSRADLHIGIIDDDNIRFENNSAEIGGAISVSEGNLEVASGFFFGNSAVPTGGGGAPSGGAVHIRSNSGQHSFGFDQCVFGNNSAEVGGALYTENVTGNMLFSQMFSNQAEGAQSQADGLGGGIALLDSTFTLQIETFINDNTAFQGGGIHLVNSTLQLSGAFIGGNSATDGCSPVPGSAQGGGIWADETSEILGGSALTMITGNNACSAGGGIFGGSMIEGLTVEGNVSASGGGIATAGAVSNVILRNNQAVAPDAGLALGGAIYGFSVAEVEGCTLEGNVSEGRGGGAALSTLVECTIDDNSVIRTVPGSPVSAGGGIFECAAKYCTISNNRAQQGGGSHSSTLVACTVSGNEVELQDEAFDIVGAGIYGGSAVDSQITGNRARIDTVAVAAMGGGAAFSSLLGCTIEGNAVLDTGFLSSEIRGAGLYESNSDTCIITNNSAVNFDSRGGGVYGGQHKGCVIVGNDAEYGGGADAASFDRCTIVGNGGSFEGSIDLVSCIYWANTQSFSGPASYSLVEGSLGTGTNIGGDPLFVNEGQGDFRLTMASPCVDAGDPGVFDPDGSRADMGAFPLDTFGMEIGTTVCYSNPNSSGADARLTILGSPLVAANNLGLRITDLPTNSAGIAIMSVNTTFVPLFGNSQGILCIGSPLIRFNQNIQNSGAAGNVLFVLNLNALPQGTSFVPGQTWNFQYWTRDINPVLTSNTSSAASVTFQ